MKNGFLFLIGFFLFFVSSFAFSEQTIHRIDDFSEESIQHFPRDWKTWPFHRGKAKKVYQVAQENKNRYLQAEDSNNLSEQIYKGFHWDYKKFPYLNWRWRAHILPEGGKESDGGVNDSACGVYVVFGRTTGNSMKFTWSTTLSTGTVYEKKPGEVVFKILDSGKQRLHQWRRHSIHVERTYETLMKHPIRQKGPTGIGVLTDGNATQTRAACDYDDFVISKKPIY